MPWQISTVKIAKPLWAGNTYVSILVFLRSGNLVPRIFLLLLFSFSSSPSFILLLFFFFFYFSLFLFLLLFFFFFYSSFSPSLFFFLLLFYFLLLFFSISLLPLFFFFFFLLLFYLFFVLLILFLFDSHISLVALFINRKSRFQTKHVLADGLQFGVWGEIMSLGFSLNCSEKKPL